ncbi:5982_t:CDS:2 [Entrophospora sp. SA101]|nr:5982_t:CDS:2 [Entrophospora sp. SA101]
MPTSIPLFTLNNNVQIPALGLLNVAVKNAALTGYRLIDSAVGYGNEGGIGKIIKEICCDKTQGLKPEDPMNETNRQGSWEALEKLYSEGKVRSIGVCNYTKKHLTHLLANCKVVPAVHQFELHPLLYQDEQKEIIELTKKHNIRVEAYSSLGEGQLVNGKIKIPIIKEIADKHKVTEAQVLLRWGYQHDAIVIPKSVTPERIKINSEIFHFELSNEDMESLNALSKTRKKRFCWDPTNVY